MNNQQKYAEEFEKYKNILITLGVFKLKSNESIVYEVIEYTFDSCRIKNTRSGFVQTKTGHWARKNLEHYTGSIPSAL